MKTFTVKISDDRVTARDIKDYIWHCNSELDQEDITVSES